MKRFIILFTVAVITFGVIYLLNNPDLVEGIWLYMVGLFGVIVKFCQVVFKKISDWFKPVAPVNKQVPPPIKPADRVKQLFKIVVPKS